MRHCRLYNQTSESTSSTTLSSLLMVSTPRKRNASRSPLGSRHAKRILTSSPEEGEVDDPNPPPLTAAAPMILPIPLPSKPAVSTKVPFPFKKKVDSSTNGTTDREPTTPNVFDRFEPRPRDSSGRSRGGKHGTMDHWEPSYGRGSSLLSRVEPYDNFGRIAGRGDSRDRERRRWPSFCPPSPRRHEEYERDQDYRERWEDDSRRYGRRDLSGEDRYYRPSSPTGYQRDEKDWTRRDHDSRSRHDYPSRWPPSRRVSPVPSTRSRPISPLPPDPIHSPQLQPPSPQHLPEPEPPSEDTGPRPPSSTPPPAPPPDPRLAKVPALHPPVPSVQLPPHHAQVKIRLQRPDAPRNIHSPVAMEMASAVSTAKAMVHGVESRVDNSRAQQELPPPEPTKEQSPSKKEFKVSTHPLVQSLRSKPFVRRTHKEEVQAYGHAFVGCGKQEDYETTTKLGEGTFGFVFCYFVL